MKKIQNIKQPWKLKQIFNYWKVALFISYVRISVKILSFVIL